MLGELFDKHGSDKQRLMNYGPLYDEILAGRPITRVLEIGVKTGASLLAWAEAFPLAEVHGIDTQLVLVAHPRVSVTRADSTSEDEVPALAPFDLIVDDGCHALGAQCRTMRNYLPLLHPEGVYVVEDVETEDNVIRLMQLASIMGFSSERRVSDAAPNIYDNRMVVVAR
jgi:predicted O-methyltransferase YrrM